MFDGDNDDLLTFEEFFEVFLFSLEFDLFRSSFMCSTSKKRMMQILFMLYSYCKIVILGITFVADLFCGLWVDEGSKTGM